MRAASTIAQTGWRGGVLVPTMGALHAGHAALIRRAADEARARAMPSGALVWIFVNPTQFNQPADLARYPRTLEADVRLCHEAGAAAVLAPSVQDVYPHGPGAGVPPLPPVATQPGLEDACRPGHFAGVCQVVHRMFELCRPAAAVFGEKDWQQLQVIQALVAQQRLDVEIIPVETVREPDGLAMSSRNVFLSAPAREQARALSGALAAGRRAATPVQAEAAMRTVLDRAGISPDYAAVRDAQSLGPVRPDRPGRALVAAPVGGVRLIDNGPWEAG